jgi:hypothetical protein
LYAKLSDQAARLHKAPAIPRILPARNAAADESNLAAVLAQGDSSARFCSTCSCLLSDAAASAHSSHDVVSIRNVFTPSRSLPNLGVDEESAQCVCLWLCRLLHYCDILRRYFFHLDAVDHLLRIIKHSGARSVVCIGCPSVHEALLDNGSDSVPKLSRAFYVP